MSGRQQTTALLNLQDLISAATGKEPELDRKIAQLLLGETGSPPEPYTSSVDKCIELISKRLSGWHWHIGHGPSGILPYASLRKTHDPASSDGMRVEALAPTVPLALLKAAVQAAIVEESAP